MTSRLNVSLSRLKFAVFGALGALVIAVPSVLAAAPVFAATTQAGTSYVSVTGSGSDCTESHPCLLPIAVEKVANGGTVLLSAGNYGDQTLKTRVVSRGQVNVKPVDGAAVTMNRLD